MLALHGLPRCFEALDEDCRLPLVLFLAWQLAEHLILVTIHVIPAPPDQRFRVVVLASRRRQPCHVRQVEPFQPPSSPPVLPLHDRRLLLHTLASEKMVSALLELTNLMTSTCDHHNHCHNQPVEFPTKHPHLLYMTTPHCLMDVPAPLAKPLIIC